MKIRTWMPFALLIAIELGLFWFAKRYYDQRHLALEVEPAQLASSRQQDQALEDIAEAARTGSWKNLDQVRARHSEYYKRTGLSPSRGVALYFFPETLPKHSLERSFATGELSPALQALRQAHDASDPVDATQAYGVLKSRVENYELGAITSPAEEQPSESLLSDEAMLFLDIYGNFAPNAARKPSQEQTEEDDGN